MIDDKERKELRAELAKAKPEAEWFVHDRFGMFIHWGLYAMASRHEWVKSAENITTDDYQKYFDFFHPDLFDPKAWARMAREAGMKYFVITTKHHEGFCLWDTKYTDYKATNTPARRDLLREMVDAFRAEGLKVGFYYSLIDWHHPDFPVEGDPFHPQKDNAEEIAKDKDRDMSRYAQYMRDQVRELLTGYGRIDVIWFDFSYPGRGGELKGHKGWESERLLTMVRELQPHIIVDDRLDLIDVPGGWDIKTPEQVVMRDWPRVNGKKAMWETCQTFSGSWGYYRDEKSWKSDEQLITMLIDSVSKGGNLLLNVGPTSRGQFDYRAQDRLGAMGKWMAVHERSIRGCTQAPEEYNCPPDCRLTWNPETRRLYVHLLQWPFKTLYIDGLGDKVAYAQLLNDGSEIIMNQLDVFDNEHQTEQAATTLQLKLPTEKPPVTVPVIELMMK
jgi:alpha-L-fucosidase